MNLTGANSLQHLNVPPPLLTPFAASTSTLDAADDNLAQLQPQAPTRHDTILEDALTACLLPSHAGRLLVGLAAGPQVHGSRLAVHGSRFQVTRPRWQCLCLLCSRATEGGVAPGSTSLSLP